MDIYLGVSIRRTIFEFMSILLTYLSSKRISNRHKFFYQLSKIGVNSNVRLIITLRYSPTMACLPVCDDAWFWEYIL